MAGFENYAKEAAALEVEIERKGIALGIDWDNAVQVRQLAREALNRRVASPEKGISSGHADFSAASPEQRARDELFGLANLMLKVMQESAGENIHTHGGKVWKSFAKALWAEHSAS